MLSLWAFRGLPLGTVVFWLAPFPVFLAGLGFGPLAAWWGVGVAVAALLVSVGVGGAGVFAASAGVPAALIATVALARRGTGDDRADLAFPLALLGLWPALAALLAVAFGPPGFEEALRREVAEALTRSGLGGAGPGTPADPALVEGLVRWSFAAAAASLSLPLLLCGVGAQRWLARRGLALRPTPRWSAARLPSWYVALPLAAFAAEWAAPDALSTVLAGVAVALFVPLVLQGLAAIHGRKPGRGALVLFYVAFALFLVPVMAAAVAALGLFDQFGRRAPPAPPAPPQPPNPPNP